MTLLDPLMRIDHAVERKLFDVERNGTLPDRGVEELEGFARHLTVKRHRRMPRDLRLRLDAVWIG